MHKKNCFCIPLLSVNFINTMIGFWDSMVLLFVFAKFLLLVLSILYVFFSGMSKNLSHGFHSNHQEFFFLTDNYHYFIIPTRMGNPKLICSGYEYLGNRRNIEKQREYCICKNYSKSSCKARAVIYKEGGVSFSGTHNHPPPATTRNMFHGHFNFKKVMDWGWTNIRVDLRLIHFLYFVLNDILCRRAFTFFALQSVYLYIFCSMKAILFILQTRKQYSSARNKLSYGKTC